MSRVTSDHRSGIQPVDGPSKPKRAPQGNDDSDFQERGERFSKLLRGQSEAEGHYSKGAKCRDEQSDSEADGSVGRERQSPAQLLAGDLSKLLHGRGELEGRDSKTAKGRDEQQDSDAESQSDGDEARERQSPAQLLAADRILHGMLSPDQPQAAADSPTPVDSRRIGEIADKLAQRILVSDAGRGDASEVRIHLRDSVMAGTEITLTRQHGTLVVNLAVPDTDLVARLQPHADTLERTLEQRLDTQVRIRIQGGDPGTGQPHDGRSRNRGDPWNEQDTDD